MNLAEQREWADHPLPQELPRMSVEEYFSFEQGSDERHEYRCGYVEAMAGATARHNIACLQLASGLMTHLAGTTCQVFMENLRLNISMANEECFYYPDVMVACEPDDKHPLYRRAPKFLCEVLSSNVKKDKIDRYFIYKSIPSLEQYLVISPDPEKPEVTLYSKALKWINPVVQSNGKLAISSLNYDLDLDHLYKALEGVND